MLSSAERALMLQACRDHPVADCAHCGGSFRYDELAADLFQNLRDLCKNCRVDLTLSLRGHLVSCVGAARLTAQDTRGRATITREESAEVRKESQRLRDARGA